MRLLIGICLLLASPLPLSGCAVVSATASVVGAAGTLVGATANAAAGAVGAVAGSGKHQDKKPDCGGADKDTDTCKASSK